MKTLITNYIFDKTARTITFVDLPSINLEQILLITNVTSNVIIYNFADSSLRGITTDNILTLNFDTSVMNNSDKLQIFIDNESTPSSEEYQEQIFNALLTLIKSATYARDGSDRIRMIMDNNPMLYSYMRNSSTSMVGGTESWYSTGSFNVVDARENLKSIQDQVVMATMQKWRAQ